VKYTCTFRDDVDQQVWSGKGDTRASHKAVIFVCLQECFRHIKIDGCVVDEFFQNLYSVLFRERRVDPRPDAVCMHARRWVEYHRQHWRGIFLFHTSRGFASIRP